MTTTEATTTPEVVPNKIYRPFREVFPESKLQLDIDLPCFDAPWNTETLKTPPKMEGYQWRDELLVDLILWLLSGKRALKLIGHVGTGKTSLIMEFAAALNQPLLMVPGTPRTEAYQLIGGMLPADAKARLQRGHAERLAAAERQRAEERAREAARERAAQARKAAEERRRRELRAFEQNLARLKPQQLLRNFAQDIVKHRPQRTTSSNDRRETSK